MADERGCMVMRIKVVCFNCGARNELDIGQIVPKRNTQINLACLNCGALNVLNINPRNLNDTEHDWQGESPEGFEWVLPVGKITPITGDPIYMLSSGEQLSRKAYMERYKVDAEFAYQYIRRKKGTQKAAVIANKPGSMAAHSAAELLIDSRKDGLRRFWDATISNYIN
jgi:hypothetical protein